MHVVFVSFVSSFYIIPQLKDVKKIHLTKVFNNISAPHTPNPMVFKQFLTYQKSNFAYGSWLAGRLSDNNTTVQPFLWDWLSVAKDDNLTS